MPKSDSAPKQTGDSGVIRLLLLGDSAVGKSSLLLRFCEGRFENNFVITIGVDFKTKNLNIDGKQHRVQVWDTAGQERFRTITPAYYRNAMGVLILFDVTNKKSFDSMWDSHTFS
jgi:small GTP-binding protein